MTGRYDIYRNIHMALRANMAEVLLAVGRMDPEDLAERAEVLAQAQELVDFCRMHLAKEDRFLHPAMESRAPGSARQTLGDHDHHKTDFEALDAAITAVEIQPNPVSQSPGRNFPMQRSWATNIMAAIIGTAIRPLSTALQ